MKNVTWSASRDVGKRGAAAGRKGAAAGAQARAAQAGTDAFGYFDDARREYVVTRPDTPKPWINYLGIDSYCGLISHTAGGYSFCRDPRERRILRYRYNSVPEDRPGRYIYVRDDVSGEYWSATWQPVMNEKSRRGFECRHGMGYTKVSAECVGIETQVTYFVPREETLEIWHLRVNNSSRKKRRLSLFTYVEFCLWDAMNDMTDFQYNLNIGRTTFSSNTMYHLTNFHAHQPCYAWFWSSAKVKDFDGERGAFLGQSRSEANPIAVERGKCGSSLAVGWSPFAGLHVPLELGPGAEEEVTFVLGYGETWGEDERYRRKYKNAATVHAELARVGRWWDETLGRFSAETPDPAVNSMVNTWNQYQCRTTFNWSRSASYWESGIGRGMGFRDSNQDILGFAHQVPALARERLLDIAATQFPEGRAHHQYSPLTKKGNGEGFGDDHLWLIIAAAHYVKESGDYGVLAEKVPYNDGSTGTLEEHLHRALGYSTSNPGWHGLPRIENADWNDCLNLKGPTGKAASVMVAQMYVMAADLMASLVRSRAAEYGALARDMKTRINQACWDGAWYLRAFADDGTPVGSARAEEGKIWLETQTWAVLSGVAEGERAVACMDSVKEHLATKHGIVLFSPAYSKWHPELGYVSVFPKGLKENAAIFCHTNPWAMIAETLLGRGDQAFRYYKAILPSAADPALRWTEPYVYAQMVAGKEHRDFGQAKNSWLTGTASWNFAAVSQYILGVRPDFDGLRIDPCIPHTWKGFTVTRVFRGDTLRVAVRNPAGQCKGVRRMTVDGRTLEGNLVPVFGDGKTHEVEVTLE